MDTEKQQAMQLLAKLIVSGYEKCSDCDEWTEWVSCPECDEYAMCAYCVSYIIDGTMKCEEMH